MCPHADIHPNLNLEIPHKVRITKNLESDRRTGDALFVAIAIYSNKKFAVCCVLQVPVVFSLSSVDILWWFQIFRRSTQRWIRFCLSPCSSFTHRCQLITQIYAKTKTKQQNGQRGEKNCRVNICILQVEPGGGLECFNAVLDSLAKHYYKQSASDLCQSFSVAMRNQRFH